jgi:hypothetical protein
VILGPWSGTGFTDPQVLAAPEHLELALATGGAVRGGEFS